MYPKQFIRFFEEENCSLLGATLKRFQGAQFAKPTLLCNNNHRFLLSQELDAAGIAPREILLEPEARNTAPAIAAAASSIASEAPDGIMVVAPSDHIIRNRAAFARALEQAAAVADGGRIALFGAAPDTPHTGYGYIRQGVPLDGPGGGFGVAEFVEKPDAARAAAYLAEGVYFWNCGIFVFQASAFLREAERHAPDVVIAARRALQSSAMDLGFRRLDATAYAQAPNISVDYSVMEKTRAAAMIPLDAGWSDAGSWASLWEVAPRDANGNVVKGDVLLQDVRNSYIHSGRALVAALGVENLVIVDTADAILVADKSCSQEVGGLVAQLKERGRAEHEQHVRSHRPWGHFETLNTGPRYQVKRLHVKPGGKLSMQMHHHRSEHWVVVKGTALVTVAGQSKLLAENESIYISATQWHRLENPGKVPLEIIEVQIGTYLGEDDIIRTDDVYGRSPDEVK
jgi:mannose-1-phosphate guanylyltransferase/mannose-6-phosphate isomerase